MPIRLKRSLALGKPRRARPPRDSLIDWTAPARLLEIERATPDRPARTRWPRNLSEPYSYESLPDIGSSPAEGPNELLLLWTEFALRRPQRIIPQPEVATIEVDGRVFRHIVDYLVIADGASARIEVKGATGFVHNPFLPNRLRAIASAYANAGLTYEVATAARLRQEPMASNVSVVFESVARHVEADDRKRILSTIGDGPATIEAIAAGGCLDKARRDVASLHAHGLLTAELLTAPLGPSTMVSAGRTSCVPPWWRPGIAKDPGREGAAA